jgi:hypothetical protein
VRYSYDVVVPINTLETAPYVQSLRLEVGTLTQVIIRWRAGCHHRVFVAIYDGLMQIVPAPGTAALYADDQLVAIPMDWPIYSSPFELQLKAWSPGTFWEHKISVWLDLEEHVDDGRVDVVEQMKFLLGV